MWGHSFRNPYCILIFDCITSNALLTVESLLDTEAFPNLVNMDFIPHGGEAFIKPIKSPQLRMENHEGVNFESIVPFLVHIGDLRTCLGGILENLAVAMLLGTLFIDQCIAKIFSAKRKLVPWPLRPVAIFTTKTRVNSIYAHINEGDCITKSPHDAVRYETCLWHVPHHATMQVYTQATALIHCQQAGPMTIENHCNIV